MATQIEWDNSGERFYETGVDHGVLYVRDDDGFYKGLDGAGGVPWNGLTAVNESPSGAEANPQYADNIKYLNLMSAEELGLTIEAFTYPEEFGICDGTETPAAGMFVAQQGRRTFGLSYRTVLGNDVRSNDYGYKLHLAYGILAAPSEKAYATINDSPEAITFSWECTTTKVDVPGLKPTSLITIDSTKATAGGMAALEKLLYGDGTKPAELPLPEQVIAALNSAGEA